jgi:hypothetical protein
MGVRLPAVGTWELACLIVTPQQQQQQLAGVVRAVACREARVSGAARSCQRPPRGGVVNEEEYERGGERGADETAR